MSAETFLFCFVGFCKWHWKQCSCMLFICVCYLLSTFHELWDHKHSRSIISDQTEAVQRQGLSLFSMRRGVTGRSLPYNRYTWPHSSIFVQAFKNILFNYSCYTKWKVIVSDIGVFNLLWQKQNAKSRFLIWIWKISCIKSKKYFGNERSVLQSIGVRQSTGKDDYHTIFIIVFPIVFSFFIQLVIFS